MPMTGTRQYRYKERQFSSHTTRTNPCGHVEAVCIIRDRLLSGVYPVAAFLLGFFVCCLTLHILSCIGGVSFSSANENRRDDEPGRLSFIPSEHWYSKKCPLELVDATVHKELNSSPRVSEQSTAKAGTVTLLH